MPIQYSSKQHRMKTVTSKDNPVLKSARKLLTRKGRKEAGAFLVEGWKLISEAAAAGFEIDIVFINAGSLLRGETEEGEWANEIELDDKLFCDLAQSVNPQPLIAVVRRPGADEMHDDPGALWNNDHAAAGDDNSGVSNPADRILILDRVGDPGNVGAMIRTALASGIDEVWCVKGTAEVFSDKVIRASAGAVFHKRIWEGLSVAECIDRAKGLGARLVVCDADGSDLFKTALTGRLAAVIGNENAGPNEEFLGAADAIVGIPMARESESLNAAIAAAIVMYEALRQRNYAEYQGM